MLCRFGFLSFVLLALSSTACGTSTQSNVDPSLGEGELSTKPANPTEAFTRLTDLLKASGSLQMPDIARQNGATDFKVNVDVVANGASIHQLATTQAQSFLNTLNPAGDVLSVLDDPDRHLEVAAAFESPVVKDELLKQLIVPAKRSEARTLLAGMSAAYVKISVNDLGSEIVGDELILIQPFGLSQTLVIRVNYVAA
jgi:hypothetical protein